MKTLINKLKPLLIKLKPYLLFMAPFIFIGSIIGAYPGYLAYRYVWMDAGFCTTCHVHDYASVSWRQSSHKKLTTCHDCHHQPLHEYIREAYVLIAHRPKFPKDLDHIPFVPKGICKACHLSNPEDISSVSGPLSPEDIKKLPKVDRMHLHSIHLNEKTEYKIFREFKIGKEGRMGDHPIAPFYEKGPERDITCSDCHGGPTNRAHNFSAVDLACVRCHEDVHSEKSSTTQKYGCRGCHFQEFMMPVYEDLEKIIKQAQTGKQISTEEP